MKIADISRNSISWILTSFYDFSYKKSVLEASVDLKSTKIVISTSNTSKMRGQMSKIEYVGHFYDKTSKYPCDVIMTSFDVIMASLQPKNHVNAIFCNNLLFSTTQHP